MEESTNKILSAWGQAGEALKFANLPSSGQGTLTINAKVVQPDGSEKEQGIQIFYREASKLNPASFGIANKLTQHLHQHLLGSPLSNALLQQKNRGASSKADEEMDKFVVDKDVTLIFLHGQHYASSTWQELGTLDFFANQGYKIYGIDMPGYGHSDKVTVRSNEWLIDVIQKLVSSQDEEGNIDADGGEHHTDSKEKNKIHKIAIVSPDIAGLYTLDLLYHHREKLGASQKLELVKFVPISLPTDVTKKNLPPTEVDNENDVKICSIAGAEDVGVDKQIFEGMSNAQSVEIPGSSKHVYLDNPDVFHQIIAVFLETDQCPIASIEVNNDTETEAENEIDDDVEDEQGGEEESTEQGQQQQQQQKTPPQDRDDEARNPEEIRREKMQQNV